ncbi:MAG TPA: hypothetical protein VGH82_17320 [Gaiellaceae bacterium]
MPASPTRNLLLATAFLLAVGAAAFGWFIDHGGFYSDDWATAAIYRFAHAPRFWHAVVSESRLAGGRPVLAVVHPLPYALFGLHPALHLALGVVLVVATCVCFYAVLRLLGLASLDAAAIALLALLFPWADSMELWPTASLNTIAVIFFFAGLSVALYGLNRAGTRGFVLHGVAAALYLLSILTYEVAGAAAILVGALYVGRAPLRRALQFWAIDVVVVLGGLIFSLVRTSSVRHVGSLHDRASDLPHMTRDAIALAESALLPFGRRTDVVHVLIGAVVVVAIAVLILRTVRGTRDRSSAWLVIGAGALVAIAAAYFMFLGSTLHPLDPATSNRLNVFARFAYAVLIYALLAAVAQLVAPTKRVGQTAALAIAGLIAVGYAVHLGHDESGWAKAARLQRNVLSVIDARFPRLDPGATVVTFGYPALVQPGAPIFYATWDFPGAVQLQHHDKRLSAVPVYETVELHCRPQRLVVRLPGSRGTATPRYSKLFFLDVPSGHTSRIASAAACGSAIRRFRPGPYFAGA